MGFLAGMAGAAVARAADAASRAADLALVLPRRAVPQYVHVGQQVYLHRKEKAQKRTPFDLRDALSDPLVPMGVKPSLLAAHRMISYRVRMMELYTHNDPDLSFSVA